MYIPCPKQLKFAPVLKVRTKLTHILKRLKYKITFKVLTLLWGTFNSVTV